MAHIPLDESIPGMRSLLTYHPSIAPALTGLMQVVMRSKHGLKPSERELIAAYVSRLNYCTSCENIHSAVARHLFDITESELTKIKQDFNSSDISERLKALLAISEKIQRGGSFVTEKNIDHAKAMGCTHQEIHDTVLITSLFCMFNKYIDGLSLQSQDTWKTLDERGYHIAREGYSNHESNRK